MRCLIIFINVGYNVSGNVVSLKTRKTFCQLFPNCIKVWKQRREVIILLFLSCWTLCSFMQVYSFEILLSSLIVS